MSTSPNETPKPEEKIVWWHMLLLGIAFFAGSGFIWWYLTGLEERGGGRVHWLLAVLYDLGGKPLCVGVVAVFGLIFTAVGIGALVKKSKAVDERGTDEESDA